MPCDKQSTTVPPSLYKRGVRSVCHHLAGNWTPTGCSTCNSPESKKRTYLVCSIVNPTPIVTRVETVVSGSGISVGKPCGLANVGTFLPGSYPSLPVTRYSKNRLITFLGRLFPPSRTSPLVATKRRSFPSHPHKSTSVCVLRSP